jgi:hypothetical protein
MKCPFLSDLEEENNQLEAYIFQRQEYIEQLLDKVIELDPGLLEPLIEFL